MLRRFSKFPLWRIQTFVKIQPQNQRFFANVSKQNDDDDDDIDHDEGPLNPDRSTN